MGAKHPSQKPDDPEYLLWNRATVRCCPGRTQCYHLFHSSVLGEAEERSVEFLVPSQWVLWCRLLNPPVILDCWGGKVEMGRWTFVADVPYLLLHWHCSEHITQVPGMVVCVRRGSPICTWHLEGQSRPICCCLSVAQSCPTLWAHSLKHTRLPCPSLFPRVCSKVMSIELVMSSNHLIFSHPLLFLLSIFPSIRVFFNESALHIRWPKDWSFSFGPSNDYSGLIYFRIDLFDLFAVQGTLKSLLQHHNSEASILWCSAFFMVQLSHPYMTTGKTIALTIQTSVSKVMSLLFNTLSRFVIVFLPRSKYLLISWQRSPSPVILKPKKIKSITVSSFPHLFAHLVTGKYNIVDPEVEKNLENKFPRHKN